jgi:LysM repeat protein
MRKIALLLTGLSIIACGQLITPEPTEIVVNNTPTVQLNVTVIPTVTARPTATPRPATPAPTPTPTVTPTPIIYQVQRGDTLLGIAIAYGVSVEAIQTANGIVDPRSLQIDQFLVIPNPEEEGEAEPTPTPTPFPVVIQGVNFQKTPQNTLWCFGEVVNPGNTILSEMVVEINLYDVQGKLLASKATFTQLDILASDQSVPFAVLFDDPPSSFAQYQVSAISAVPIYGQTRYYLDLTPIETSVTQVGQSTYRISGQLQNTGSENAEAIKLVAVAYDATDKILGQRQAALDVVILRSQARTPFQIDLTVPEGEVDRYVVQAQALRTP